MSAISAREPIEDGHRENGGEMIKFLIVDDDDISILSIKRTFRKLDIQNPVFVAHDGIEALSHLRGDLDFDKLVQPYVVLLDLNMPRMSGLEFLQEVRNDPKLRRILVFVMTTSDAPRDVTAAYDKNIAGYVMKDNPFKSFAEALKMIDDYANLVVFPS